MAKPVLKPLHPVLTVSILAATGEVTASGAGSSDPNHGGKIVSYRFDWGDGQSSVGAQVATHTYVLGATYTLVMTITDNRGATGQATAQVVLGPGSPPNPPPPPTLVRLILSGATTLTVGQTITLVATAQYSDGSTQNVTSSATWVTASPSIATVSAGVVTGVAAGTADITATFQTVTATTTVTVSAPSGNPPAKASAPTPANGATGVDVSLTLSWTSVGQ